MSRARSTVNGLDLARARIKSDEYLISAVCLRRYLVANRRRKQSTEYEEKIIYLRVYICVLTQRGIFFFCDADFELNIFVKQYDTYLYG